MKKRPRKDKKKPTAPKAKAEAPKAAAPKAPEVKAATPAVQPHAVRREPTVAEIRARAYQRFLSRGGAPGRMIEAWVAAERELKAELH